VIFNRVAYTGGKPALTPGQADQLRQRAAAGEHKSTLARDFRIGRETVYAYLRAAATTGSPAGGSHRPCRQRMTPSARSPVSPLTPHGWQG